MCAPHCAPKCVISSPAELTLTSQRPYIVYMLQDLDILEDWTTIRKVWLTNGASAEGSFVVYLEEFVHQHRKIELVSICSASQWAVEYFKN